MAQTKPQETKTEACGILFVIEANPEQTKAGYPKKKVLLLNFSSDSRRFISLLGDGWKVVMLCKGHWVTFYRP